MAKRKRLTPAQPGYLAGGTGAAPEAKSMIPGSGPLSAPPIAQVAGESAASAALDELSREMQSARADGRLIERLPLAVIDEGHLVRDRMGQDEEELGALMTSLRARGQQTPIEVSLLAEPVDGRSHGLISGWRRLTALRRLFEETGDERFATIKALVITPDTARDAYVSMVEENEIRVNLSLYERARIALKAMEEGVYPTTRAALQGLFGSTTRSRRSKIGSFAVVAGALDGALAHPTAIPEKLGLALAREIQEDANFATRLRAALSGARRDTPAQEQRLLAAAVSEARNPAPPPAAEAPRVTVMDGGGAGYDNRRAELVPGVTARFSRRERRIELSGDGVSEAFYLALREWLGSR
jgi:ParB family transcriptional regulator, chromosome partitioning protein